MPPTAFKTDGLLALTELTQITLAGVKLTITYNLIEAHTFGEEQHK